MIQRKFKYWLAKSLSFLPDSLMLKVQYRIILKRPPNLKTPKRFSEKIQYYKAYYRNTEMLNCVDKFLVREYVTKKLDTDKYLNTLYQVCNNATNIDFSLLPKRFVIKTTDGGNGDNIIICEDKDKLDISQATSLINSWKNKKYYIISREWAYKGAKKSKIIVEQYLEDEQNKDKSIDDFKFLCFDGKFKFLWIDKDRYSNHKRGFWDENLKFLNHVYSDHPTFSKEIKLPDNIHEMITIAEKLASGFPFARIDLYNINGKIYFGEITFYPWSGYVQFIPDEFDFELGKHFDINFI